MQRLPLAEAQQQRVAAGLPFVESLARRMASTMPHSIDLGDLVQDGVLGLMDAAHRYDEGRGIIWAPGPDQENWRWLEQWLPHSTWFLLAATVMAQ